MSPRSRTEGMHVTDRQLTWLSPGWSDWLGWWSASRDSSSLRLIDWSVLIDQFCGTVWWLCVVFFFCSWDECRKCCRRSRSRCTRRKRRINSVHSNIRSFTAVSLNTPDPAECAVRASLHFSLTLSGSYFQIIRIIIRIMINSLSMRWNFTKTCWYE